MRCIHRIECPHKLFEFSGYDLGWAVGSRDSPMNSGRDEAMKAEAVEQTIALLHHGFYDIFEGIGSESKTLIHNNE